MPRKKTAAATTAKSRKRKTPENNDDMMTDEVEQPEPAAKKQKIVLGKPPKFTKARLKKYYETYRDSEEDQVGPEGMQRLCDDAHINPEDAAMLVLAFKVGAKKMGFFSHEEFTEGFDKLKIDCPEALHDRADAFRAELKYPSVVQEVYRYAFDFGKESEEKKTIDLDVACAFLKLLLPDNPHTDRFCEFLSKQTGIRAMNADTWKMWFDFAHHIDKDLTNYDASDSAYPVIIDEYAEYVQKGQLSS